jgi:hypothetical protein
MEKTEKYVSEKETADITYMALQTLRNHRHEGRGIPYIKLRRSVRYALSDIHEYMLKHRIKTAD